MNDKINGIVTLYRLDEAIKNHAFDRKVVFNAQTNRLAAEDIEERDLEEIVNSLRAALRCFVSRVTHDNEGNNMGAHVYAACKVWIKRFRAELSKNKDSTSGLAHCLRMNQLELQAIVRNEGFERDIDLNRLLNELTDVESQIMVAAPEVLEARKAANRVKIELYETDYLVAAKRMTHGMMLDSEGSLELMMAWVLYTLHDASASDEQKKAAIAFAHGALPRGARELILHDKEGTDPSKDPNILKRMGEIGDALHRADKGIDAVQEVVSEGEPWLAEFVRTLAERAF